MNNSLPLVSIITSTYNQAEYLEKAIESVINQDYPNIEYLVINDGSTDGTEEVLKKYDGKIYWETQPNMKEVPTINKALKIAKGEIIGKLSSDDYFYPGLISEVVKTFLMNEKIIVAYPDFDVVDQFGKFISGHSVEYDFVKSVSKHICIPGVGAFFHRRLLNNVPGFDTSFSRVFDLLFWWQAGLQGPFYHIPKTLGAFRAHSESQTSQGGMVSAKETIRLINTFYSIENLPKEITRVKREAFGSAYGIASDYAARGKNAKIKTIEFFIKSVFYSPATLLPKYWRVTVSLIFTSIFGEQAKIKVKKFINNHIHIKNNDSLK